MIETNAVCRYCNKPIGWSENEETGRWVPMDANGAIHRCEEARRQWEEDKAQRATASHAVPKGLNTEQFSSIMLRLDKIEDMLRRRLPEGSLENRNVQPSVVPSAPTGPEILDGPQVEQSGFDEEPF